jgi:hypothetical protein
MPKKKLSLAEKIEAVKEADAVEHLDAAHADYIADAKEKATLLLGGLNALNTLANNVSAKVIATLQQVRDEHIYRAFGFDRFDDFLDQHPYAPMGYRAFNTAEKLLKAEGEQLFDLMNGLKIPAYKRKQLGAGLVELDAESGQVFVTLPPADDKQPEQVAIALNDRTQLLNALTLAVDQNAAARQDKERAEKKQAKAEKELAEALAAAPSGVSPDSLSHPHKTAALTVFGALEELAAEAEKLTPTEQQTYAPRVFAHLAALTEKLRAAYGRTLSEVQSYSSPTQEVSDEDLAELFED